MTDDRWELRLERITLTVLLLVYLVVAGCSLNTAERLYIAGSVADLATTAYGLEHCAGTREGNPVLTVAGKDTASVIVTGALLRWGLWKWIRSDEFALGLGGVVSLGVAGHNAGVVAECGGL